MTEEGKGAPRHHNGTGAARGKFAAPGGRRSPAPAVPVAAPGPAPAAVGQTRRHHEAADNRKPGPLGRAAGATGLADHRVGIRAPAGTAQHRRGGGPGRAALHLERSGRLGGAALLGVVNSAISTAMLLALLWPTSSGSAASKFVARARGAERWEEVAAVAAHLGRRTMWVTVLLALLGVLAWVMVGHGDLTGGLCVGALVLGYSGYSFVRGVQFGAGQVQRATVWDVLSSAVGLVGLLTALVVGARGPALLLPLAAGYSLYAAAGWPRGAHGRPSAALRRVSWTTSCSWGSPGPWPVPASCSCPWSSPAVPTRHSAPPGSTPQR